jgi:hypothetical protein
MNRGELLKGIAYTAILLWMNAYICREWFTTPTAYMNSMHGFWTALARMGDGGWWHARWWPYWDAGIPFEFAYSPLVPLLTAAWSAVARIPHAAAFQCISGVVYILLPATLFVMAWLLTRAPGYAFLAGLVYSLMSLSEMLAPDGNFSWAGIIGSRRLFLMSAWDETPHLAGLAVVPIVILFLVLALQKRRLAVCAGAAALIALASLASPFAPITIAAAGGSLLCVLRREEWLSNLALTVGIGVFGWALAAPFYSPSLIRAIRRASAASPEGRWTLGTLTAVALVVLGWSILWHYLPRWNHPWQVQFMILFAYLVCSPPILLRWLSRQFVPQPARYKLEMEFALALLLVFLCRIWIEKLPPRVRQALVFVLLAFAAEQVAGHRRFAKDMLHRSDPTRSIEYRTSTWVAQNLPGTRVMLPGTIAQWANAFTTVLQVSGGSWSQAYSQIQQRAVAGIYNGNDNPERDALVSLAWLKAFGAGAVAVSGPASKEFWKPFAHPGKFEGVLPVLWREDDVTIYRVPQRTSSLAHIIPENAVVARTPRGQTDVAPLAPYIAALDDTTLPEAGLQWKGPNRLEIDTTAAPAQAVSIQVSYHPGWHATVNGQRRAIQRDGLGLMWLRPELSGLCHIVLEYDGGWELRFCRMLSAAAFLSLLAGPIVWRLVRRHGGGMQPAGNG